MKAKFLKQPLNLVLLHDFQKQIVLLNYCWNEMYDYENNILQELYL